MTHDTLTPEQWQIEARARRDAQRPKAPAKRRGKTPEAKVKGQVDAYLKGLGVINIRTNAGSWQGEDGRWIYGAKAGTADRVVCLPGSLSGGRACFAAIEDKSATGKLSESQRRYRARVESLGGIYIVAHSAADVRAALVAEFGEQAVSNLEQQVKSVKRIRKP